jgi:hypothetical protein
MKKLSLITLLTALFHVANAQESANTNKLILGGSLNFITQNNAYPISLLLSNQVIDGLYFSNASNAKNTVFSIAPYFGKEISPRLMAGVQLNYRVGKYTAERTLIFNQPLLVDYENNSTQFGVGIFTRHILNPRNQFNLFIQPYAAYNLLTEKSLQDGKLSQEDRANYVELGAGAGALYNINDKIRVTVRTGGLNYINGKWEVKNTNIGENFSSFGANLNLSSISFGFELRL